MAAQLRVYPMPEPTADVSDAVPSVPVTLGDLLPLLALAERKNYVWLSDFLNDPVAISSDLYEVLRAFRYHRSA